MAEDADLFLLHLEATVPADENETLDPTPFGSSVFEEVLIPNEPNLPLFLPESEDNEVDHPTVQIHESSLHVVGFGSDSVFEEETLIPTEPNPSLLVSESDLHLPRSETLDIFHTVDSSAYLRLGLGFDNQEDNEVDHPTVQIHGSGLQIVGFGSDSVFEEQALIPNEPNPPLFLPDSESHLPRSETLDIFHSFDSSAYIFPSVDSSPYLGPGLGFDNIDDDEVDHRMVQILRSSLQAVGLGSDSESENPNPEPGQDLNLLPFCWDSLQLEERVDDDDFEWEEVDGRIDERDILYDEEVEEEELRNVQWEVLLAVNNPIEYEEGDFGNPLEYEILFGQFAEAARGCPPARKSVVENLKEVVLMKEDVEKGNAMCAVCKDEMEGMVKELPCSHRYHGECILPWLGMRNTCPVCRFELPTDDVEYESWKALRSGHNEEDGRDEIGMYSVM